MTIKPPLLVALAASVTIGAAGGTVLAKERGQDNRDAATLARMKVSLQQAIATAEGQTGDRAVSADVSQRGSQSISVELVGPLGTRTVMVDGETGQVTATHKGGDGNEDND